MSSGDAIRVSGPNRTSAAKSVVAKRKQSVMRYMQITIPYAKFGCNETAHHARDLRVRLPFRREAALGAPAGDRAARPAAARPLLVLAAAEGDDTSPVARSHRRFRHADDSRNRGVGHRESDQRARAHSRQRATG